MKIFIAVPTFENIYPDTFKSLWGLERGGHWLVFDFVRGYDCATARNRIAQQTLDEKVDYVLMVDNDVVLPHDALINLLDDPKDVCLGYYKHRGKGKQFDNKTCVCRLGEYNFTDMYTAQELDALKKQGQYKVQIHGGGMGCALIKADVFRRTEYPWYDWVNYKDKHGLLSEDLYFCKKCGQANIPIYVDTRVGCGHMLRQVQWPLD